LVGEEFGGETIICEVSAKTGKGIDKLLEMLALQAEILDLRAIRRGRAQGVVLEARVDKGRGPIATILIEAGTLEKGDIWSPTSSAARSAAIYDDIGRKASERRARHPVEVLGPGWCAVRR
jgi:translation initiation factor IF-2